MKMIVIAFMLALLACQRTHEVTVQLGPNDHALTIGFLCRQDADPGKLLGERARSGTAYTFQVVVDVIDLGGQLAGCRGEELIAACSSNACSVTPTTTRFCHSIQVEAGDFQPANRAKLLAQIHEDLRAAGPIISDAPDRPVLIRAIATTEAAGCTTIPDQFDGDKLVGCAYSCPVQLDAIDGPIALSLDTLDDSCERVVRACAKYPL